MRAKILLLYLNVMCCFMMVGCWDANEVKGYSLVSLLGIDRVDEKIRLFLEVNSSSNSSSNTQSSTGEPSEILVSEGKNFTEARNSYLRRAEKGIFLGAMRAIVISDHFSKGGLSEYFNRIRGIKEYPKSILLFTTNTELDKLLDPTQSNGTKIGQNVEHLNNALVKKKMLNDSILTNVMENALVKHTGYLLNNIDKVNDRIEINGYSVFKDNKKVGFISESKMKGANYFILKKPANEYNLGFKDESLEIYTKVKNKKITSYYNGQTINFKIRIVLHCDVNYESVSKELNNEDRKEMENEISKVIKQEIVETIKTSQEKYECDYLQLYKVFRAKYNSEFKNMNWDKKYKQAKFNVDVKVKLSQQTF
ncbi:Ger(x)C family spore germination protein [Gottfriedia sp. NPDC057991]|uniref:Ger(x)C family spore germination protein n=1 Tax=Gottfriedia sp. NPDC057991 TaxID=3346298 RepID=UPI0036D7767A